MQPMTDTSEPMVGAPSMALCTHFVRRCFLATWVCCSPHLVWGACGMLPHMSLLPGTRNNPAWKPIPDACVQAWRLRALRSVSPKAAWFRQVKATEIMRENQRLVESITRISNADHTLENSPQGGPVHGRQLFRSAFNVAGPGFRLGPNQVGRWVGVRAGGGLVTGEGLNTAWVRGIRTAGVLFDLLSFCVWHSDPPPNNTA
jgi:hypothetical protein